MQVEIGTNPIQFPKFEFLGIDAKIKQQQEVFTRTVQESRTKNRCCKSDKVYEVDIPYQETFTYYEIDLRLTLQEIQRKIDEQVQRNLYLLQRVIQKQVSEDFQKGEKQINDYINRFQAEFDQLLKERATREVEAPEIVANLESQRINLRGNREQGTGNREIPLTQKQGICIRTQYFLRLRVSKYIFLFFP